ncbi:MAG: hypothetical protein IPI46_02795 [Bacteroidetes bacterium]|nr:hypothetical protein [Bacteroidota bacterium]
MKKLVITLFLIAIISSILQSFMPWWSLTIPCFILGLIAKLKPLRSFVAGFIGIALSWTIMILIRDYPNQHLLSKKLATLFPFEGNHILFIMFCVLIGGMVGGLFAWSASVLSTPTRKL